MTYSKPRHALSKATVLAIGFATVWGIVPLAAEPSQDFSDFIHLADSKKKAPAATEATNNELRDRKQPGTNKAGHGVLVCNQGDPGGDPPCSDVEGFVAECDLIGGGVSKKPGGGLVCDF